MKFKKSVSLFLVLFFFIILPANSLANSTSDIYLNNNRINLNYNTYIINGRTYVSINDIINIFNLNYKSDNKNIYLFNDNISITVNYYTVYCDGIHFGSLKNEFVTLYKDNTIYIPIRYVANALHKDIFYNENKNSVHINDIDHKIIYPLILTDKDNNSVHYETPIIYKNSHYIFNDSKNNNTLDDFSKYPNNIYNKSNKLYNNNIFIMHPERGYIVGGVEL